MALGERYKNFQILLGQKLSDWPFLRVLLFEPKFLVAFCLFLALVAALGLALPKIWRTTPNGFLPVIRVSVLDLGQAWSLRRSAVEAVQAGDAKLAAYCWDSAIANNPGDPRAFRGILDLVVSVPQGRTLRASQTPAYVGWLLRLTGTNQQDVALAARALIAARSYQFAQRLLEPHSSRLSPVEQGAYLQALFETSRLDEFRARWAQAPREVLESPELALYDAAWRAGWGPGAGSKAGRAELERKAADPELGELATRLLLRIAARLVDPGLYRTHLDRLETAGADSAAAHASYWVLLQAAGRAAEARAAAERFERVPEVAEDCLVLVKAYEQLALPDHARQTLQRATAAHPGSIELWIAYTSLLLEQRQWEELSDVVWRIRGVEVARDLMASYSYYLEARAELGLGRHQSAATTLKKLAELPLGNPRFAWVTAGGLLEIGQPALARKLLLALRGHFDDDPAFWHALVVAAVQLKDSELLKSAATKAHEVAPNNPIMRNNYAAALLIYREKPDVAVQITFDLMRANPRSSQALLNHALALAQNYRYHDAAEILRQVSESSLTAEELLALRLCRFEIFEGLGRRAEARAVAATIDKGALMPPQARWLEGRLAALSRG